MSEFSVIKNKKYYWIAFIAWLFLLAAVMRFKGLPEQGLLYWDEGMYMNEAKFYQSIVQNIPTLLQNTSTLTAEFVEEKIQGWPPSAVKPLHGLMIYLFSFLFGFHDYTGQIMSGIFSLFLFYLIFKVARKEGGDALATFCLIFLVSSSYLLMFSRSAFAEMDSIFFYFLSLAVYLHFQSKKLSFKRGMLCGIFMGITLLTNYRWFFMIPVYFVFAFLNPHTEKKVKEVFLEYIFYLLGMGAVLLLAQAPYSLFKLFAQLPEGVFDFSSQFTQNIKKQLDPNILGFRPMFFVLWSSFNGLLVTVLLFLGIFHAAFQRKDLFSRLVLFHFLFIFLGLSFVTRGHFARYNSLCYPFAYILAAYGACYLIQLTAPNRKAPKTLLYGLLGFLILVPGVTSAQDFVRVRSAHREVAHFLEEKGSVGYLVPSNSIYEFYAGREKADHLSNDWDDFLQRVQQGDIDYLVVDFFQNAIRPVGITRVHQFIREHLEPIKVFDNPMGKYPQVYHESMRYLDFPEGHEYQAIYDDPLTSKIRIFKVEDLLHELREQGYI